MDKYNININIYIHWVTRVTGGYKGLQGMTRGYRGLEEVKGG